MAYESLDCRFHLREDYNRPSKRGWQVSPSLERCLADSFEETQTASGCFAMTGLCISAIDSWISRENLDCQDVELLVIQLHWSYPEPNIAGEVDNPLFESFRVRKMATFLNVVELDRVCHLLKSTYANSGVGHGLPLSLQLLKDWLQDWSHIDQPETSAIMSGRQLYFCVLTLENKLRGSLQLLLIFISCLLDTCHVAGAQLAVPELKQILLQYCALTEKLIFSVRKSSAAGMYIRYPRLESRSTKLQECSRQAVKFFESIGKDVGRSALVMYSPH